MSTDERAARLREAIEEKGQSKSLLSDLYGWNYNTLKSNANGSMSFGFSRAVVYGAALGVRAEWLYSGTGEKRSATSTTTLKDDILAALIKERSRLSLIVDPTVEEDNRLSVCIEYITHLRDSDENQPATLRIERFWSQPLRL